MELPLTRRVLHTAAGTLALVTMMAVGSLVLWVGVPLGWLWVAGRIQGATGNLGAALGVAMFGVLVTIALVMALLSWLSNAYRRQRVARGLDDIGHVALEMVMATTASIVIVAFSAWFFLFSGSSPIPLGIHP